MFVIYELGIEQENRALDKEYIRLEVDINCNFYAGAGECFEEAFENLKKQFRKEYYLKNCFGCMFADYSVYGNSSFGTLYCFRNAKDQYLECASKDDYIKLWDIHTPLRVQEIDLCAQFIVRGDSIGYR